MTIETRSKYIEYTKPTGLVCEAGSSLTKQSMKDDSNINKIVQKYQQTGIITFANKQAARYDFATSDDYKQSMDVIKQADSMFAELPSSARAKFENDPQMFLDFVQDAENLPEMVEMGLAHAPQNKIEPEAPTTPKEDKKSPSPTLNPTKE